MAKPKEGRLEAGTVSVKSEDALLELLQIAAAHRGASLGIGGIDYLIGVLEGSFPKITVAELQALGRSKSESIQPSQN